MPSRIPFRRLMFIAVTGVAATLALAACGGHTVFGGTTPTPFSLGGGSKVEGYTPTPTAGLPVTKVVEGGTGGQTQPTPASGGSPADAGRQVFLTAGCTACHTIDTIPQARGNVGPNLTQVGSRAGTRKPGMSAEDYLKESVLQPDAFIAPGYTNDMPAGLVSAGPNVDNLIAFLSSLK